MAVAYHDANGCQSPKPGMLSRLMGTHAQRWAELQHGSRQLNAGRAIDIIWKRLGRRKTWKWTLNIAFGGGEWGMNVGLILLSESLEKPLETFIMPL